MKLRIILAGVATGGLLAGCVATTPPPPPSPPVVARVAPPPLVAPPRPQMPAGTANTFMTPARDSYGRYITVNSSLTPEETLWHLRMGLNVAALSCYNDADSVNAGYSQFLVLHKKRLAEANKAMDVLWAERAGTSGGKTARDNHSVEVYNFFALPMVTPSFCSTASRVLAAANATPSSELANYASVGLSEVEGVFTTFFSNYDSYKVADSAWYRVYGPVQPVRFGSASGAVTTFQSGEVTYDPVTNQPVRRPLTGEQDATATPVPGAPTSPRALGTSTPSAPLGASGSSGPLGPPVSDPVQPSTSRR